MRYGLIAGLLPGIVGFFAIILGVGLLVRTCSTEPPAPVTTGPELNDWPPWDPSPAKRKLARALANALRLGGHECQVPGPVVVKPAYVDLGCKWRGNAITIASRYRFHKDAAGEVVKIELIAKL